MLPRLRMRLREVYQSVPRREPLKENVLGHRKVGDEVALLVDDGDACSDRIPGRAENEVSIFEFERPAVGSVNPGDNLDQGRLACAILSHQRVNLAANQREGGVVESTNAWKRLGDALQGETHRARSIRTVRKRLIQTAARINEPSRNVTQ